jgi:hypothetical protein
MNDGNVLKSSFVKEQKPYSRQDLAKLFCGKSNDELIKIIKLLRHHKIIKISKNNYDVDVSNMVDEVIDVTDAIADVNGYKYFFTAVGIFIIGGFVLKCYPKWFAYGISKRPSKGRQAFVTWNYFSKDDKLIPSGLTKVDLICFE